MISRRLAIAATLLIASSQALACMPAPANCRISSSFGYRIDPVAKTYSKMHKGTDFACAVGTPIKSTMSGKVTWADWDANGGGNTIKVSDGTITTKYLHNSRLKANVGDTVSAGQLVAESGNTGHRTTGAHLHFAIENQGAPVDPALYICGMTAAAPSSSAPPDVDEPSGGGTTTPPKSVPESPGGFDGSIYSLLAQAMQARFMNPAWYANLATLDETRLHDEIARMTAIENRVAYEKMVRRERITALFAALNSVKADGLKSELHAQQRHASQSAGTR